MNTDTSSKIINQTTQYLANGNAVSLLFHYQSNFKIGDLIEVTAFQRDMQLLEPKHPEDYFAFDIEIWDDRIRLYCDLMKLKNQQSGDAVFTFIIKDISLFASRFTKTNHQKMYN